MATTRKIVVIPEKFGSTDFQTATKIVEVPVLPPGAGEIAVKVIHTGVEASDVIQMVGGYGALFRKKPSSSWNAKVQVGDLGCEGVGIVSALGEGVQGFAVGDAVCFPGFGVSFRETLNINVSGKTSGAVPPAFKVPSARPEWVAVPVSALTATGGLEIAGNIKQGMNVLVTGAAGGTGHIAVQWAKSMYNCRVAGTCGDAKKAAMLKELGCDVVVNYRTDDVEAVLAKEFPKGFDLIYEAVGGKMGNSARRLLAANGFCLAIGGVAQDYTGKTKGDSDGSAVTLKPGQRETFWFVGDWMSPRKTAQDWDNLVAKTITAVSEGKLKIIMDEESKAFVGLDGVYRAQARMREGKNTGKIFATISVASKL